jgi:hypothetical protein
MRSTVRQLITGVAVAVALSAVGVGAIGGAIAQSPQRTPALAQDGLISGYNAALSMSGAGSAIASSSSTIFSTGRVTG